MMIKMLAISPRGNRPAPLLLMATLSLLASCQHGTDQTRAIVLPYAAPYETGIRVRPAIRRECDLERRVARVIASEIRGQFNPVKMVPPTNTHAPGLALDLRIINVEGKSGGARGSKSLTVAGKLYDNGNVVGDFIATRRTKRGRHTCRMMWENIEEIAEDVSRWLEAPTRNAYLGDAAPGDFYRPEDPAEKAVPSQPL